MSERDASLRLKTGDLKIELVGPPEAIRRAYSELRPMIADQLTEAGEDVELPQAAGAEEAETASGTDSTRQMHTSVVEEARNTGGQSEQGGAPSSKVGERKFRLCLHQAGYREVYMVDGTDLEAGLLEAIHPEAIGVMHVDEAAKGALDELFPRAQTLWRELD